MSEITLNGARIHYEERGSGEQALVLAHGLLWSGRMFAPQVAALERDFRCITFDFRGQGQSEVTRSGYDMDSLTGDAAALIEALDAAPCHFGGLSMGGFVGMRLAIRRPELIRTLILMETTADPEPRKNVRRYRKLNFVARWLGFRPVAARVMRVMFGRKFLTDPDRSAERDACRGLLFANRRKGVVRATRGVIEREGVCDRLGEITCPTLVIVGDQDVATPPARAERIHERISGSRLVVIPGAGHTSSLEEPEAVTRAIREFLVRAEV